MRMTWQWWASFRRTTNRPIGRRWDSLWTGAIQINCSWMSKKQRRSLLISGKSSTGTHHLSSITVVEVVSSVKFLGVQITDSLTWTANIASLVKRAQQRLFCLRRMRRAHFPSPILSTVYKGIIESILTSCISVWSGDCKASDWRSVQRVVRTAEKIIGSSLPSIQDLAHNRCLSRAQNIVKDPTHPHYGLFTLLPSGKRFRSIRCRTVSFCKSFFLQAIRLLNLKWPLNHFISLNLLVVSFFFLCDGDIEITALMYLYAAI